MTAITTAPVRTIDSGLRQDLRGVKVVWYRELLRFGQDRIRIVAFLVQPLLFLFVLGTGLSLQQVVKVGESRGDRVAILSGLKPGEEVVTSGVFKLRPGVHVQVNNSILPENSESPTPEDT